VYTIRNVVTGDTMDVKVRRKLVGARSYTHVPAQRSIPFATSPECTIIEPLDLSMPSTWTEINAQSKNAASSTKPRTYCVIGSGKTSIDSIVFMVRVLGIAPEDIFWYRPTNRWFYVLESLFGMTTAKSWETKQQLLRLPITGDPAKNKDMDGVSFIKGAREQISLTQPDGLLCRINPEKDPSYFYTAIVELADLKLLRSVGGDDWCDNGRIAALTKAGIELKSGKFIEMP